MNKKINKLKYIKIINIILIFILIGGNILIFNKNKTNNFIKNNWETITGIIISSEYKLSGRASDKTYNIIKYKYKINNIEYIGQKNISLGNNISKIKVYYNPQNISESTIGLSINKESNYLLFNIGIFFFILIITLAYYGVKNTEFYLKYGIKTTAKIKNIEGNSMTISYNNISRTVPLINKEIMINDEIKIIYHPQKPESFIYDK